jgi:ubiquinone/menaquinone biosynthesis C-methylase UbiE
MSPDQYFLGHSLAEQRRLQQQARELATDSSHMFDQLPLLPGARVLEIGCGPQGCLQMLSDRVGPTGSVVGVEMSEEAVSMAQAFVAEHKLRNVEVRHGNAKSTGLATGSFDLATARLVLVNVPQPEAIVIEMAALLKSGGVLALHEADWGLVVCDPPLAEWDRMIRAFQDYSRVNGIDSLIGRRLSRLLRTVGLTDVHFNPLVHIYDIGHSRRTIFPQFAGNVRERMLAQDIMSTVEFDKCVDSIRVHLADPGTLVIWAYFQAWATKP